MITGVTRKALIDLFHKYDPDPMDISAFITMREPRRSGIVWWGDLNELSFLSRLYDLESMPSTDDRFDNAYADIAQHRTNNDDWIFYDNRFNLQSSDNALLSFLIETLHPEVRSDSREVTKIKDEFNRILAPDLYALKQSMLISGRPVYKSVPLEAKKVSVLEIRDVIAEAIRDSLKAYEVEGYCDSLGLPIASEDAVTPMGSKAGYAKDLRSERAYQGCQKSC